MENIKFCEYCGKEIDLNQKYGSGRFCNKKCQLASISKIGAKAAGEKNKREAEKRKVIVKCLCCGKEWETTEKERKFCSSSCAAKYNNSRRKLTNATKEKIGKSLVSHYESCGYTKNYQGNLAKIHFYCSICGKEIKKTKTGLCKKCLETSEFGLKLKSEAARKAAQERIASGKHKGWQTRNISSYAEKFWVNVLDNNKIPYKKEFRVKYGENAGEHYFLDFLIRKNNVLLDLEIDGKQHQYKERREHDIIRDEKLSNLGYRIYRIQWNEINSDEGKQQMKIKIDNFISFFNNL